MRKRWAAGSFPFLRLSASLVFLSSRTRPRRLYRYATQNELRQQELKLSKRISENHTEKSTQKNLCFRKTARCTKSHHLFQQIGKLVHKLEISRGFLPRVIDAKVSSKICRDNLLPGNTHEWINL